MKYEETRMEEEWEALARHDPFWTACTSGKRHMVWKLSEFLETGEKEVAWTTESAKAADMYPASQRLAIDFGCGPGRLTGALAQSFQRVVGIDISPTMLDFARRVHAQENISFNTSTQDLAEGSADLVYSTFVLQHFSKALLASQLNEFSRLLDAGGLLIFQYPSKPRWTLGGTAFKILPSAVTNAAQRHVLRFPAAMPMNWMHQKDVCQIVTESGFSTCKSICGLTYSPNWQDSWYLCAKRTSSER
jgi:ubiquinone/menaquinone biosynthesis C-methylase UbiE